MGSEKRLDGKIIIITGAGSGFGRKGAVRFAKEGAKLVLADIDIAANEETIAMVKEIGGEAVGVKCDVANPDDVKAMVQKAVDEFGRLDGIWNNAGIQGESEQDIFHCPVEMIDRYVDIDIKGVWYGCHFAARELVKTKGTILNTASIVATLGTFGCSTYGAAKGAVQSLTYTVAWELGRLGVRCNCISPYCAATPGTIGLGEEHLNRLTSGTVYGRLVEVDEVVNAAVFLMSDAASAVTGFDLRVDLGAGTRSMPCDVTKFLSENPY